MQQLTWFDIEEYVLMGEECDIDEQRVLFNDMVACLMAIWAQCCDDRFYEKTVQVTLAEGQDSIALSSVATDIKRITRMTIRDKDGDATIICTTDIVKNDDDIGTPTAYEIKGYGEDAVILFDMEADCDYEITICYQREPSCDIRVSINGVLTYQVPDIPPALYPVLRDHVKARYFASRQDWSNASPQLQLANAGFDAVKPALNRENSRDITSSVSCLTKEDKCNDECDDFKKGPEIVYPVTPTCFPDETEAGKRRTHEYSVRQQ